MIDASPSLEAAKGISGKDLFAYLNAEGWTAAPSKVDGIMILSKEIPGSDQRAEFIIPIKTGFNDEEKRVADALRTIAQIQGRSEVQIAESVQQASGNSRFPEVLAHVHGIIAFLNDKKIENAAQQLRKFLGLSDQSVFNIVEVLENEMPKAIDRFRLEVVATTNFSEVYSSSEPPCIFVTKDIYRLAREDDAKSRYTLAHEIGHLFLHSPLSHFEGSKYAKNIESAEWQASKFAMLFLIPDSVARRFKDPELLSRYCKVERTVAERRMNYFYLGKERVGDDHGLQQLRSQATRDISS
jgi:Zn-dependent peptidase ImmA (M78 family)